MTLGDLVAVMRKGVLQQLAPPDVLYSRPANVFVAGFIGSPPMNLLSATLERDEDRFWVRFGDARLPVPSDAIATSPALLGYLGKDVVLGIRPEHMDDAALVPGAATDSTIPVTIEERESVGSDVFLHFSLEVPVLVTEEIRDLASDVDQVVAANLEQQALERRTRLTVRAGAGTTAREGDERRIFADTTKLYFFDPETGRALLSDASATAGVQPAVAVPPSASPDWQPIPTGQA
jgi:multiple sugar transport system ATP-binding protein